MIRAPLKGIYDTGSFKRDLDGLLYLVPLRLLVRDLWGFLTGS